MAGSVTTCRRSRLICEAVRGGAGACAAAVCGALVCGAVAHAARTSATAMRLIVRFMSPNVVRLDGPRHLLFHLPDRSARVRAERARDVRELLRTGRARGRPRLRHRLGGREPP